jgi:S1-C subfamily serine protease
VGWISARWPPNTIFRDMPLAEFLQTTATINTGNSGGPVFNMAGEVIGIVSQNISKSGGSEGLGFIVSINSAKKLLVEGKVFWGALQGLLLTGRLATVFNVPAPAGFLVKTVAQGSMAWSMGLQGADGIVTMAGKEIPGAATSFSRSRTSPWCLRRTSRRSATPWPRWPAWRRAPRSR